MVSRWIFKKFIARDIVLVRDAVFIPMALFAVEERAIGNAKTSKNDGWEGSEDSLLFLFAF